MQRTKDLRGHRRRRRLPVRRRYDDTPTREPPREPVDRAGVERGQELAGNRRPAAPPKQPREPTDPASDRDFKPERGERAHRPRLRDAQSSLHQSRDGRRPFSWDRIRKWLLSYELPTAELRPHCEHGESLPLCDIRVRSSSSLPPTCVRMRCRRIRAAQSSGSAVALRYRDPLVARPGSAGNPRPPPKPFRK